VELEGSILVVHWPSFFGLHEGAEGFGRAYGCGLFSIMFHDGAEALGRNLDRRHFEDGPIGKCAIIRQIRSGFVEYCVFSRTLEFDACLLVVLWPSFFGLHEGAEGSGRTYGCGLF
jgi:hypothetical protein